MTDEERAKIKHLSKCNFKEMHAYYTQVTVFILHNLISFQLFSS